MGASQRYSWPQRPRHRAETRTLIQILNGEMPIGMQARSILSSVRDLAAGTIAVADRGRKGECYILSNDEVSLKELCEMLKAETGCRAVCLPAAVACPFCRQADGGTRRQDR